MLSVFLLAFFTTTSSQGGDQMQERFQGHHLRRGRFSKAGNFYVLTAVVEGRRPVSQDWHAGRSVVEQFRSAETSGLVRSMAWVVMPDHFHWLIELRDKTLAELMCRVKSRSSHSLKRSQDLDGRLWQRGYYDRALRRDEHLQQAARDIIANPLRAGLVQRVGDYPLWDAVWL
jgi:REP element-mobilizing transposase RayT